MKGSRCSGSDVQISGLTNDELLSYTGLLEHDGRDGIAKLPMSN